MAQHSLVTSGVFYDRLVAVCRQCKGKGGVSFVVVHSYDPSTLEFRNCVGFMVMLRPNFLVSDFCEQCHDSSAPS